MNGKYRYRQERKEYVTELVVILVCTLRSTERLRRWPDNHYAPCSSRDLIGPEMTPVTAVTVVISRQTNPSYPFLLDKVVEACRSVSQKLDLKVLCSERINVRVLHWRGILCPVDYQCEAVDRTTEESALSQIM
jgi:hypothetical protein